MKEEQHERMMSLLALALELEPGERPAFIEDKCRGNASLQMQLLSLLEGADRAPKVLPTDGAETLSLSGDSTTPPTRIGPYHLRELLSRGGMGEVYLAEQDPPLHRLVALKLIRRDLNPAAFIARFEQERQAMALMHHDNIAQVFDAGATSDGRPYIAMEYVAGTPLDEFCETHHASLEERLELFCQVCRGVQHAHQKGVIHRDLKPSNVLVTKQDERATPKIIDFGVAKAYDPRLNDRPLTTVIGQRVGTPEFMSPEQTQPENQDIDTRTDVYSLGMILYVLMVGGFPFDFDILRRKGGNETIYKAIREDDPPPPSRRVLEIGGRTGSDVKMFSEVRAESKMLRRDLDWIALRALDKRRNFRYPTPNDLAEDIQRYLHKEPVSVGPPALGYRLGKFVLRHRAQVAAAGLVGIAVLAALVTAGMAFVRISHAELTAREEAAHATQEATTAKTVIDLLIKVFQSPDPSLARGKVVDAREVLRVGTERVLRGLESQPAIRARMMDVIGLVETNLSNYKEASRLLNGALDFRRKHQGDSPLFIAESLDSLGHLGMESGHPEAALTAYREGLSIRQRVLDPKDPRISSGVSNVGVALRDLQQYQEARPLLERALELREDATPADLLRIAESHMNLANVLSDLEVNDEALAHYKKSLEIYDRLDRNSLDRANVLDNLGTLIAKTEGCEAALSSHQKALAVRKHDLPELHPDIASSLVNTANDLLELKRYREAKPYYEEAIGIYERRPELGRRSLGWAEGNLSALFIATGQFPESERRLDHARKILVALDGPNSSDLAEILEYRAGAMKAVGRFHDADSAAAEAKKIRDHLAHHQG